MNSGWIRKNDIGYPVTIQGTDLNEEDLTNALSVEIQVMKPNGEDAVWAVNNWQRNENGIDITHIIQEGDIDDIGLYSLNVHIMKSDNEEINTPTRSLQVKEGQT